MIESQPDRVGTAAFVLSLREKGVFDIAVLRALETVSRESFAPRRFADLARADLALPLPCGQTMTSPTVVAQMLVALGLVRGQRVLEIGTGSGYVTALLIRLGGLVCSVERRRILHEAAAARLQVGEISPSLDLRCEDGLNARDDARFDRIILNGSLARLPDAVTSRLMPGGRLVAALAGAGQPRIVTVTRSTEGSLSQTLGGTIRIAPLVEAAPTNEPNSGAPTLASTEV